MDLYGKLRTMDVLIVDDDPWMRDALATFFGVEGVRCTSAGSIGEGIEEIGKRNFGVIFCNFWMEGMDGLSFLKDSRIRQPDAVRILIAPFVPGGTLEELKEEHSIGLLRKPIRIETMEKMIGDELSRRNPATMHLAPPCDGTKAKGTRPAPGGRKPLPREDSSRVISHSLGYSRKRPKGKEGGPAHGEDPAKIGADEAHRPRLPRNGEGEG